MNAAVFLDRDGVIIEDVNLLTRIDDIQLLPTVPQALNKLKTAGFELIVVTNQTVIARGLASEEEAKTLNRVINEKLKLFGGPVIEHYYICPHHPSATLPAYQIDCNCRKPRPGLLLRAARELDIDLESSFMVGDRITDIIAGEKAGCRTILLETGKHNAAPIESKEVIDENTRPDFSEKTMLAAAEWILGKHPVSKDRQE